MSIGGVDNERELRRLAPHFSFLRNSSLPVRSTFLTRAAEIRYTRYDKEKTREGIANSVKLIALSRNRKPSCLIADRVASDELEVAKSTGEIVRVSLLR